MGFWKTWWSDTRSIFHDESDSPMIALIAALVDLRNRVGSWPARCESQADADMIRTEFNDWYTNKLLPLHTQNIRE